MATSIEFPTGDVLVFDAAPELNEEHAADITERAVERGAPVSDHHRPRPIGFTLEGLVTPSKLKADAFQVPDLGSPELTDLANVLGNAAVGLLPRAGDPTKPGRAKALLSRAVEESQLLVVRSSTGTFTDMMISGLSFPRDAALGKSLRARLTLRQIRLAEATTSQVPALAIGAARPGTPAAQQAGQARVVRGRATPTASRGQRPTRPVTPAPQGNPPRTPRGTVAQEQSWLRSLTGVKIK